MIRNRHGIWAVIAEHDQRDANLRAMALPAVPSLNIDRAARAVYAERDAFDRILRAMISHDSTS